MPERLITRSVRIPKGLDKELEALSGMKFSEFVRRMCIQSRNNLQAQLDERD